MPAHCFRRKRFKRKQQQSFPNPNPNRLKGTLYTPPKFSVAGGYEVARYGFGEGEENVCTLLPVTMMADSLQIRILGEVWWSVLAC